jgi:predicted ferric reductase
VGGAYVLLVTSPLLLMAVRPAPPGRPFLVEASIALGFVGLVMMAIQFALIGRFALLSAPFGIDALLRYHRTSPCWRSRSWSPTR